MDSNIYVQLVFLCLLNILFTFSGVILNSLVIVVILKSTHLRKKICNFMILVLSCVDLLTVVTYRLGLLVYLICWLAENYDLLAKIDIYRHFSTTFAAFSWLTLIVLSIERYLGAAYPVFHRVSVTRRKLLIFLAVLLIFPFSLFLVSYNSMVISFPVATAIFMVVIIPPFLFLNYKLFKISRRIRLISAVSPEKRVKINLKNISTCLLAIASFMLCSVPLFVYVALSFVEGTTANSTKLTCVWGGSIYVMNCTFNCLIFFWKNRILRIEGVKVLKMLKVRIPGF